MNNFAERGKALENKYALDQAKRFEAEARASKMLGLKLAKDMGLNGQDAEDYALSLVSANLEEPGFDDVIRKVRADLEARNMDDMGAHMLSTMLYKYMEEAAEDMQQE